MHCQPIGIAIENKGNKTGGDKQTYRQIKKHTDEYEFQARGFLHGLRAGESYRQNIRSVPGESVGIVPAEMPDAYRHRIVCLLKSRRYATQGNGYPAGCGAPGKRLGPQHLPYASVFRYRQGGVPLVQDREFYNNLLTLPVCGRSLVRGGNGRVLTGRVGGYTLIIVNYGRI